MPASWHSQTRGSHALEWITSWPTEPVRVTGVTDVVIPASRSWPGHMLRRWLLDPSSGMASPCDSLTAVSGFTADATIQGAPGYLWP